MDVRLQYTEGDPDAMARAEKMVAVDEAQRERALARSPSFKALARATSFNRGSPIRAGSPRTHTEEAGALLSLTVVEGLDIVNPDAVTHVSGCKRRLRRQHRRAERRRRAGRARTKLGVPTPPRARHLAALTRHLDTLPHRYTRWTTRAVT